MKVTFVNPPLLNVLENRQYPPLGILYLAAMARTHPGAEVTVCDLGGTIPKMWEKMVNFDADIYAFTCFSPSFQFVVEISKLIKSKHPHCKIVVGGNHPSAVPDECLKIKEIDSVVIGEGEHIFLELLKDYEKTGTINKFYHGQRIFDLDKLPYPAYDLVDMNTYNATLDGKKALGVITARSCPFNCAFCSRHIFGSKVAYRSAENVIGEVNMIKKDYSITAFNFLDDVFTLNNDRLDKMLAGFKKMDITFICNGRANFNKIEDFKRLKDGGCTKIGFGIESGSQRVLDLNNKRQSIKEAILAVQNAKKAGISTKAFFVFGLPGENEESVKETMRFIEEADPDQCNVYTFVPYPGTDIWNNPDKYGIKIINRDFRNYYQISTDGTGGKNVSYSTMSDEEFFRLREMILKFVKDRQGARSKGHGI